MWKDYGNLIDYRVEEGNAELIRHSKMDRMNSILFLAPSLPALLSSGTRYNSA